MRPATDAILVQRTRFPTASEIHAHNIKRAVPCEDAGLLADILRKIEMVCNAARADLAAMKGARA